MSAKQVQSELGLVGDVSPNLEIMHNASKSLQENFDKDVNELSKHDAILFIGQAYAGLPVNAKPDESGMAINAFVTGGGKEVFRMLVELMGHDERLMKLFTNAVIMALLNKFKDTGKLPETDDGGPQDELLRKLMGFDPDKEKE